MGLDIVIIGIFNGIQLIPLIISAVYLCRKCKKRVHLSTAVIMVALIGILLGANITRHDGALISHTLDRTPIAVRKYSHGFPFSIDCIVYSKFIIDEKRLPYDIDWSYRKLPNGDIRIV